jgi:hypothetical protein
MLCNSPTMILLLLEIFDGPQKKFFGNTSLTQTIPKYIFTPPFVAYANAIFHAGNIIITFFRKYTTASFHNTFGKVYLWYF